MLYRAILVFIMMLQIVSCHTWEDKFQDIGCKGKYDMREMAHLERICEECYDLYKEQDIHLSCRSHCFGSETFVNCMVTVTLNETRKQQVMISGDILRGVNCSIFFKKNTL